MPPNAEIQRVRCNASLGPLASTQPEFRLGYQERPEGFWVWWQVGRERPESSQPLPHPAHRLEPSGLGGGTADLGTVSLPFRGDTPECVRVRAGPDPNRVPDHPEVDLRVLRDDELVVRTPLNEPRAITSRSGWSSTTISTIEAPRRLTTKISGPRGGSAAIASSGGGRR